MSDQDLNFKQLRNQVTILDTIDTAHTPKRRDICLYGTPEIVVSSTSYVLMQFDNSHVHDTDRYEIDQNGQVIVVKSSGIYDVMFSVNLRHGDGIEERTTAASRLLVDGVEVSGVRGYSYHRTQDDNNDQATNIFFVTLELTGADQFELKAEVKKTASTTVDLKTITGHGIFKVSTVD